MDRYLGNIIYQLLSQYGADLLLDGNRFCALIDDLAPDPMLKTERKVLQRLNQENILPEIYLTIYQNKNDREFNKLELLLKIHKVNMTKKNYKKD